jgi:hypothetical protein
MLNRRVLTSVVAALATTITTQSFAQDRGTGASPAAGAKAGATQGTFMMSDAIPWKPADPRKPDEGDCIEFAYFDGKLDFIPVDSSYRYE